MSSSSSCVLDFWMWTFSDLFFVARVEVLLVWPTWDQIRLHVALEIPFDLSGWPKYTTVLAGYTVGHTKLRTEPTHKREMLWNYIEKNTKNFCAYRIINIKLITHIPLPIWTGRSEGKISAFLSLKDTQTVSFLD